MNTKKPALYIVLGVFVILVVASLAFGEQIKTAILSWGAAPDDITDIATDCPQHRASAEGNGEPQDLTIPEDLLFLAMGIDTKTSTDQLGVRTDTIMLCRVSFKNSTVKILSIPRDSRVPVKGRLDKINHAHSYGGVPLAMTTVQDYLNVDIPYYVRLDYQAVKALVDSIGGVEIDVKSRMYYNDPSANGGFTIDFQPGLQTLSGDDAILYLRYRSYPEGDVARVRNQQEFMTELLQQGKEKMSLASIPGIASAALNYTDTNLSLARVIQAMELTKNFDRLTIETYTLPGAGTYIGDTSYYIIDEPAARDMIQELFGDYLRP